jgi:hypothetical protein
VSLKEKDNDDYAGDFQKSNFPLKEKCPRAYLQGKYHAAHHVFFLVL